MSEQQMQYQQQTAGEGRETAVGRIKRRLSDVAQAVVKEDIPSEASAAVVGIKRRLSNVAQAVVQEDKLKGAVAGTGSSSEEALFALISGALFGMVSPVVGHPFDLIKTKMQTMPAYSNTGFFQTARMVYGTEGIRGFYRGFIPPLVSSIAFRSLQFSAYAGTYAACSHYEPLDTPIPYTGGLKPSVFLGSFAAAVSRAVIETPMEFVKVRKMVGKSIMQDAHGVNSSMDMLTSARAFAGSPVQNVMHMYHGFTPTLFRTMGLLGSFFIMADYSARYIPEVVSAPLIGPFFKGGICATAAWTLAFPFESAKSVIQADATGKYKNMPNATFHVLKQLYNERGIIGGWYRGFGPGAGRSFVANGTSMIVYALAQDFLRSDE